MAEARAAVAAPKVGFHDEGTSQVEQERKVARSVFQNLKICAVKTRTQIASGLWPTTWDNLLIAFVIISSAMHIDHPKLNLISKYFWQFGEMISLDTAYPYHFRLMMTSFLLSVIYFVVLLYTRQYVLRALLSYRGWLYEPPRSVRKSTILWALLVKLVSGRHPRLNSFQNSLPRMAIPSLKDTINGLLVSVQDILNEEDFLKIKNEAQDFKTTIGPKLQAILHLKSWWAPNYYADWWEKYVYHMGRSPIPINSNYYCLDQSSWAPTTRQVSRAAGMTTMFLQFRKLIATEQLEPLVIRGAIPLCMWQYKRMFGTTRIPGVEIDHLEHHRDSEHIVILVNGHFYKLSTVDAHGKELSILDLESQFEWVVEDSKHQDSISEAEKSIAALTATDRTTWANTRRLHFSEGINRDSLEMIESSIMVVVLIPEKFNNLSERAKYLLHGDGRSSWFDKSVCLLVFQDGKCGLNCEHSWADAPVIAHLIEYSLTQEFLYRTYNDRGSCQPFGGQHSFGFHRSKSLITPLRLYWDMPERLTELIDDAYQLALKNNNDVALSLVEHVAFGKGFIKKIKMSPDAFIQCALQLAYFKDAGHFALTYEACMTRLYLHGRTETVRSFSSDMKSFVESMEDSEISKEESIRLLRKAAEHHQKTYRDCMSGKGIDRHLFSLYVVCKGQGYASPFLQSALQLPWTLSTSQQPQQQMNRGFDPCMPEVRESICPGGGFGPVADDGYGVSYMVPDDRTIYFHISSKVSSPHTDSERFGKLLFESLAEMKALFDK